jgi:uncharacterized protein YydD (DUF2326 family)
VSLDELRADLKRNIAEATRLTTVTEIRDHFINTMWPFIEAVVDVVDEMDDAVAEMVDQQEDYLQAETAGVFAAVVQSSLMLTQELRKRAAGDELLVKRIEAHEQLCQQAIATLGEITMIAPEGEEGDDDADDDDDEEEDSDA